MRSLSTLPSGWLGAALAGRFCAKLHLIVIQTEIMIPLYGKYFNRRIRVPYVCVIGKYLAARRKRKRPRDIRLRAAMLCSACGVFQK